MLHLCCAALHCCHEVQACVLSQGSYPPFLPACRHTPLPRPRCLAGNGLRSGRKVLRRPLLGAKLAAWYPPDPIKRDPLMLDLKAEA